jgi:UDP-N-acetylglucosamine:LPS N-acetylglucosamine transferase
MPVRNDRPRKKLLAVASGGGHWVQLLRLSEAFSDCEMVFVTVNEAYRTDVNGHKFYSVPDGTRKTPIRLIFTTLKLFWITCIERPDALISTGAAPGYLALRIARLFGARTTWIDSIANIDHLSMSGSMAGRYADLWLTQWPHLARECGPQFRGAVL